jgi:hypothetical protein
VDVAATPYAARLRRYYLCKHPDRDYLVACNVIFAMALQETGIVAISWISYGHVLADMGGA